MPSLSTLPTLPANRSQPFLWGVQIPLSVLVLTSEIRAGLWKRNGSIMPEQVINYSEPPFCKMFRDMDLLQIQFAGAWTPPYLHA